MSDLLSEAMRWKEFEDWAKQASIEELRKFLKHVYPIRWAYHDEVGYVTRLIRKRTEIRPSSSTA